MIVLATTVITWRSTVRILWHISASSLSLSQSTSSPHKYNNKNLFTHTHTHPFNGPFSRTTRVRRYQKGKTNLDFTVSKRQ